MREKKKLFRRLMALVLALVLLLPLAGPGVVTESSAVTQAEINALKNKSSSLASQKKDIQNQLKAVQSDKNAAMKRKELLENQIDIIQQEIDNINEQIAMYDQLIEQKAAELAQAEADEQAQYELFCERIRYMEEQGETSYWSILFSSSDFSELLDNYMMIEEIIQYDNQVMDDLVALQDRVSVEKNALEEAQAEQEDAKAQQQSAQKELKDQEGEVDRLIDQIKGQEDQLEAMEAELNKAARDLDAQIKAKEKEYAAQIAQVKSESGFMWPLPSGYNKLSSLYGNRKHPVTGKAGKHSGIDIPAPSGTSIYAAKSGVVITSEKGSGSYWSYGNYVLIAHSDGTSTLYAHMSKRAVSKGDTVKQGQTIGYVGITGRTTGYHLHFEVRKNGNRVDPVNYFQDKALYIGGKRIT